VAVAGSLKAAAFFLNLLVPLPIAMLTLRRGAPSGLLAVTASAGLLALAGDTTVIGLYLLQYSLASTMLPYLLRNGWSWDRGAAVTLTAIVMVSVVTVAALSATKGMATQDLVKHFVTTEIAQVKEVYSTTANLPDEQKTELFAALDKTGEFLQVAWVGIIALFAGALLLVEIMILSILPGTRQLIPGPAFIDWKAPEWLVWPLIAAGFAVFLGKGLLYDGSVSLLVFLVPIYFVQGLAIISYFFQQRGTPPWLRAAGYLLVSLLSPLPLMVAGLGLFDLWADFRKPRVTTNNTQT